MDKNKRFRLSLDLDAKARRLVDELAAKSGGITITELFRRSLALYKAVNELHESKGRVIFRDADGSEQSLLIL